MKLLLLDQRSPGPTQGMRSELKRIEDLRRSPTQRLGAHTAASSKTDPDLGGPGTSNGLASGHSYAGKDKRPGYSSNSIVGSVSMPASTHV